MRTRKKQREEWWLVLSSSCLAGGCWGILEAVIRLASSATGEYDAIFWGYVFYGLFGVLLALPLYGINSLLRHYFSASFRWSLYFCVVLSSLAFWILGTILFFFVAVVAVWLIDVFLRRSPLKILPTLKGGLAMGGALLILTAVFSLTTGPIQRKLSRPDQYESDNRNVLLLSIDGLRADRLRRGLSPSIDHLRSQSQIFEEAYSESTDSKIALQAILGGQHQWLSRGDIPDSFLSFSELALERGYHTGAIVNDISLGVYSNLDQGFEEYTFLPPHSPLPFTEGARRLSLIQFLLEIWAKQGNNPGRYYRSSSEVFAQIKEFLSDKGDENWFLYAHFRELEPPLFMENKQGFYRPKGREILKAYDDQLRRIDGSIGSFLVWFNQQPFAKNSVLILLSTKGASLGEDSNIPQLRVPLSIYVPQRPPMNHKGIVQLIDLPPTMGALLSFERQAWSGVNILHNSFQVRERPIYFRSEKGWSMIQLNGWRYMHYGDRQEGRLFNIDADPRQMRDLHIKEPRRREELRDILSTMETSQ
ncbi:MAG: sulfatase-like hydrolase/transferase [Myxococcota bacterium]|nr:sulfatase-like hydrolase/transferase [Myxococcota bacterium]